MLLSAQARTVLDLIGSKEAPHGFDTVYGNNQTRMPRQITSMTIAQVIADGKRRRTAYGSSAAGRYQFMPPTLQSLVKEGVAPASAVMTPDVQDQLGYALLVRRGFEKYMAGSITMRQFGLGLAQEWASFPVLSAMKGAHRQISRGQSYYAGDGLNKALVSAAEVEAALRSIKAGSADVEPLVAIPAPIAAAPEVATVPRDAVVPAAPWWQRLVGIKPAPPANPRPGLAPNGDPALWDVQSKLKRFGYEPMLLDGLNGRRTRDAVRAARERNGLPPGDQIDAAFMSSLPGMQPAEVSETRAETPAHEVQAMSPDLFAPLKGLLPAGLGTVAMSAIGGASDAGLMDRLKGAADSVTTTAGSIQQVLDVVFGIGRWIYSHPWIIGLGAGGFIALKAYVGYLKLVALWRQSRAS